MHILIIPSEEFLPNGSTTIGIFQYHQAKALREAGHTIGVISISQAFSYPMIAKGIFYKLLGKKNANACEDYSAAGLLRMAYRKTFNLSHFIHREKVMGIEVWRVDGFFYRRPVENKNHAGWIKAGHAAFDAYVGSNGKPDVVHAHNAIYAGMLAKAIKKGANIPYIITEHSTAFARKTITDTKVLQNVKEAYDHASVLTAVSEPFCRLLNKQFSINRFQCLHNVLDPDFEKRKVSFSKQASEFIFINIAELHPKKDHRTLLVGFKNLHGRHANARLWIGGDGDLAAELKETVKKDNLEHVVSFLGPLSRDEVFNALKNADCFVLTSKYETFGVVVIESMLLGKPVIVTRCGGPESFVTPQTGIVIDKEDPGQLADAMEEMMNATTFEPNHIREYVLSNFGAASFVVNVEKFYRQAVVKGQSASQIINVRTKENAPG